MRPRPGTVRLRHLIAGDDVATHPELLRGQLVTGRRCPCGGTFTIDMDADHGTPDGRITQHVIAAGCSDCESVTRLTL